MHLLLSVGPQGNDITHASIGLSKAGVPAEPKGLSRTCALMIALVLASALPGCASYQGSEKCAESGCLSDAQITSEVRARFAQERELDGPDRLDVNTINHVVYLSGIVETGLHRDIAASIAQDANGVTRVVNNISISK